MPWTYGSDGCWKLKPPVATLICGVKYFQSDLNLFVFISHPTIFNLILNATILFNCGSLGGQCLCHPYDFWSTPSVTPMTLRKVQNKLRCEPRRGKRDRVLWVYSPAIRYSFSFLSLVDCFIFPDCVLFSDLQFKIEEKTESLIKNYSLFIRWGVPVIRLENE